jgi:hypothetical protein
MNAAVDVVALDESVIKRLRAQTGEELMILVAIDGKGRQMVLRAPEVEAKALEEAEFEKGIPARSIKTVTASALVHFEGSNCCVYQTVIAGQMRRWVFCC